MICPNCGKEYNEKMTCCISCGTDLIPAENDSEDVIITDLSQDNESVITPIISEIVPVAHSGAAVSFDSDNIIVPIRHSRKPITLSGTVRFAGSAITAVIMFVLILAFAAATGFRLMTDENRISEFAESLDVMALPAKQFTGSTSTIQDVVYTMSQGTGLTRDDIRTIYEDSTAKDFLAVQLTSYAEYIRNGTVPERLTTEQLKKVFEENIPLIDSALGKPLNDHDIALAQREIERTEPLLNMLSYENMERTVGENTLAAIRLFASVPAIVVIAALAAAMLIVFHAINKKSARVLNWGGGTILAGGAGILAATFLFSVQFPYANTDRLVRTVLKCVCDVISPDMYRIGGTLAVMGIIMLVWAETLQRNKSSE